MNIRNIPTWLGLLAALYLVTACDRVYDDLSGCLGNTIVFSYLADDNREHLQEYVDDIDVFIFDVGNGASAEYCRAAVRTSVWRSICSIRFLWD